MCTLGLITLHNKKIKSNNYQFLCVLRLINSFVLFLLWHLNCIDRYSTMKIGHNFFVWVYFYYIFHLHKKTWYHRNLLRVLQKSIVYITCLTFLCFGWMFHIIWRISKRAFSLLKKRHIWHHRLKNGTVSFCPVYHFAPVSPKEPRNLNFPDNNENLLTR